MLNSNQKCNIVKKTNIYESQSWSNLLLPCLRFLIDYCPAKETSAECRNTYRMPEPHRSTIDYHFYSNNGYIIFNPDIHYNEGYPGEDVKAVDQPFELGY